MSGEESGREDQIDLGKLQMILVTLVLVLGYGIVLGFAFYTRDPKIATLPQVNDAFAILLAISHGGYIGKKAAPSLLKKSD